MISKEVTIQNSAGLHARPAQKFVQLSSQYQSSIKVIKDGEKQADAKSILGLMSLGLTKGTRIKIEADGPDEAEAVNKLVELIDSKFGE